MAKSKEELLNEAKELGLKDTPEDYQELRSAIADAKKEEPELLEETKQEKKETDLQKRWNNFLEKYKIQSPVKYEEKKSRGEFKEIPSCFRG